MCVLPVNAVERMRRPLPTYKSYASLVSSVQSFEAHPMTPFYTMHIASRLPPNLASHPVIMAPLQLDALLGRI